MLSFKAQAANWGGSGEEMADDPSHLHAPPDLRQSALRDLAQARDNRALFIEAMADPLRRGIAFDVVERNCRERFAEGEDGIKLYQSSIVSYSALSGWAMWAKRWRIWASVRADARSELWKMARRAHPAVIPDLCSFVHEGKEPW
jgi:hypothetical protein